VRWWRLAAGACLGLSLAAKWSGLYYIVFFGALLIGFDMAARRAAGVARPFVGTVVRDVAPAVWAFLAVPVLFYLASWLPWIASETGTDRHAVGQQLPVGGAAAFLPDWLRGLAYYSTKVLEFHATLDTPRGSPHPWESKPWTWPMGLRPMLYSYESGTAEAGCGGPSCVSAVMLIGTPALWWASVPALGWSIWRVVTTFDWRHAAVLVGYGAGFLPWFADIDRQMYFFYAATMSPFLVMAIAMICGDILHQPNQNAERRTLGLVAVSCYVALVITNFAWLYPILTGIPISQTTWNLEIWLPSWR
jgi:dolichyl-phosphate-mannose-protein mannosyltransferase